MFYQNTNTAKAFFSWLIISFALTFSNLSAAPKSDLWSFWQQSNEQSKAFINHRPWQQFLNKYLVESVDKVNLIKYASVSKIDRKKTTKLS